MMFYTYKIRFFKKMAKKDYLGEVSTSLERDKVLQDKYLVSIAFSRSKAPGIMTEYHASIVSTIEYPLHSLE